MKTKKLNKKNTIDALVTVGGVIVGVMVSGAIKALVPDDKKKLASMGMTGAGTAGALFLPSTDPLSTALRSVSLGIAAKEGYELSREQLAKIANPDATSEETGQKLISGALGLRCPNMPLRAPEFSRAIALPRVPATTLETNWNEGTQAFEPVKESAKSAA